MSETAVLTGGRKVELFTKAQIEKLTKNGLLHPNDHNAIPCVYLLGENRTYILSEICSDKIDTAYGICAKDGKLTLDFIDLDELYAYHENKDYLFNDVTFRATYTISIFMSVAKEFGTVVSDDETFDYVFAKHATLS